MKYALKNMFILNGHSDMTPIKRKAILIDDEIISNIVDENEIPDTYETIDLNGKYLLPGLINMHIHTPATGKPTKKKMDYEKVAKLLKLASARKFMRSLCKNNLKIQLLSGSTTVRTVGGLFDFDSKLRDQINAGKAIGPRVLSSNYAVSVPGGHMTGSVALPVHSAEEAASMVRDLDKTKPDLIKLMITGGVLDAEIPGEPGVLKMPEEYAKAAVDQAHALGYKVAAHVESSEGMLVALRCGVDTLEHGGKATDEIIDLFREKGSALIATLSPAIPFSIMEQSVSGLSDMDLVNGIALFENMKQCIGKCLENGVTVGLGTDTGCPFTTHYDFWRELYYFCKYCGVTPAFAIHTATEINAKIAGIDNITGTVDIGKSADLLIVDNDPLSDISALRSPSYVIFRGSIIENPKIKKYSFVEDELDKLM